MAFDRIEAANKMTIKRIEQLHETKGLVLVIEDGKITDAEFEGGNYNG